MCPPPLDSDFLKEKVEAYQSWRKTDEMARCYILASVSNILQHQHENMVTAYDMMMNLKEMFGEQNRASRQVAIRAQYENGRGNPSSGSCSEDDRSSERTGDSGSRD